MHRNALTCSMTKQFHVWEHIQKKQVTYVHENTSAMIYSSELNSGDLLVVHHQVNGKRVGIYPCIQHWKAVSYWYPYNTYEFEKCYTKEPRVCESIYYDFQGQEKTKQWNSKAMSCFRELRLLSRPGTLWVLKTFYILIQAVVNMAYSYVKNELGCTLKIWVLYYL